MMNHVKRLFKEEDGQAMTEYGLLVGLIAIALSEVSSIRRQLALIRKNCKRIRVAI